MSFILSARQRGARAVNTVSHFDGHWKKSIQLKKNPKKQTNQVWPIEACMRNDEYRFIHIELLPNLNY